MSTLKDLKNQQVEMEEAWNSEKSIMSKVQEIKEEMDKVNVDIQKAERDYDLQKAAMLKYGKITELEKLLVEAEENVTKNANSGDALLRNEVLPRDIRDVVSKWTGIPVSKMEQGEREKLLLLGEHLHKRVVGQEKAVQIISEAVQRSRAGLSDPNRPYASFMFLGSTGVGKTELAKALAEFLFDSEDHLLRFDMSEYMEKHTVSRFVGAPPGYVGYEEGG